MTIVDRMKRLSYSPSIAKCVSKLGLRNLARRAYAGLHRVPGVRRYSIQGIEASFQVRTPLELRCVEATWFGEQEMLNSVLSDLRSGSVFLDVGSNLGMFTVFAAKAAGSRGMVYAFEPETQAYARLTENIRLNSINNVKVFKQGLSDTRGHSKLLLGQQDGVSQSSRISEAVGKSEVVEIVQYDWLMENQEFPVPKVVKIDVEGHEFAALQGMRRALSDPSCVSLFCEVHPADLPTNVTVKKVLELIEAFGFEKVSTREREMQVHVIAGKPSRAE
jgi:FkbM family methyltransferase